MGGVRRQGSTFHLAGLEGVIVDLHFAGAEQPIALQQLDELGVRHIAISFFEWQRRHSTDLLFKHIPKEMNVIVTPGAAKKEAIDWKSFAIDYVEFCQANMDEAIIYDFDAPFCPPEIREEVRGHLSELPNVVMFPMENETVEMLSTKYERIGINSALVKSIDENDLRRVQGTLFGSNVADPRKLRVGKFVATTTFAWLSGRRYGELWVFARNKMNHYAAENLARGVPPHARDIEAFGVDSAACAANDKEALTKVAVRSLQAMAISLSKRPRDRRQVEIVGASADLSNGEAMADGSAPPGALVLGNGARPVTERERVMLPVISVNAREDPPKMETNSHSLRLCDSCYLSAACPKYKAESACAFEFPVEIRTDAQWEQASQVILEMQFERIGFARFAEQVDGGALYHALARRWTGGSSCWRV